MILLNFFIFYFLFYQGFFQYSFPFLLLVYFLLFTFYLLLLLQVYYFSFYHYYFDFYLYLYFYLFQSQNFLSMIHLNQISLIYHQFYLNLFYQCYGVLLHLTVQDYHFNLVKLIIQNFIIILVTNLILFAQYYNLYFCFILIKIYQYQKYHLVWVRLSNFNFFFI